MSQTHSDTTPGGIELFHLTRRFGRTAVVDDLSLTIRPGTTCGFLGLNGAGKTTTIRMAVGLLRPSGGAVHIAGHDVPADRGPLKFRLGYVPDRPTVYGWMRVGQAVDFCRSLYGPAWHPDVVDRLLKTLRLDPAKRVKHLSKGAGAKLSLLLAVGHDPDVLILDEPTGGFDPLAHDEFLEGLLSAGATRDDRPRTVLFSSHALADVQRLADTVAVLHKGRLLLHRPLEPLLASTKRLRVVLDDPAVATVSPPGAVREVRHGREWTVTVSDFSDASVGFVRDRNQVAGVDVVDLTLDDVFRDYVRAADPAAAEEVAT